LLDSIVGLLREQRRRIFEVDGGPERGQFHHKRVLEAIEQRDPEKTRAAMRDHLEQVREDSLGPSRGKKPVAAEFLASGG
jgi:GntR family transcriptional repressor for pyruvate dehydrogenase complex